MATGWKCTECGKIFNLKPQDGYCSDDFTGRVVPVEIPDAVVEAPSVPVPQVVLAAGGPPSSRVEGLGILVCDGSVSMDTKVFPDERKDLTRLQLVVGAVQSALLQMLTL